MSRILSTEQVVRTPELQEQQLVSEIRQLWPSARKSIKALGEKLFSLRNLCKENGERFNQHLKTLGIPRSSAYAAITAYEELVIVDFEFPAKVVKFASIARINVDDMSHRAILYSALNENGSADPSDAQAISIVGVASAAIEDAAKKANTALPQPLTPLQQCLAEQDAAFVSMYRVQTKNTKNGTPKRAAAEGQYVRIAQAFLHPAITNSPPTTAQYRITESGFEKIEGTERAATQEEKQSHLTTVRDLLLRLGRGKTTLNQEFKSLVDAGLWFF
jgi:hypothetical protein